MPLPLPQSSDKIFESINAKSLSGSPFSLFEESQIRNEIIKSIMPSRPYEAHSALGALAQCQGDEKSMRKHFRIALQLSPKTPELYYNYARALAFIGFTDEAREQLRLAFSHVGHDTDLNDSFIELAAGLGDTELAAQIAERGLLLHCNDGMQWIAPDVLLTTTAEEEIPAILEEMFSEQDLRKHSVNVENSTFSSFRDFANKIREHV